MRWPRSVKASAGDGHPRSSPRWPIVALTVTWLAGLLAIALTVVPDGCWYSYFAVDYSVGFIRRGLAGELVGLVPTSDQLTALKFLRWLPEAGRHSSAAVARGWRRRSRPAGAAPNDACWLCTADSVPAFRFRIRHFFGSTGPVRRRCPHRPVHRLDSGEVRSRRINCQRRLWLHHRGADADSRGHSAAFRFGCGSQHERAREHLNTGRFWLASAIAVIPGVERASITGVVTLFGRRGVSATLCERVPHLRDGTAVKAWPPTLARRSDRSSAAFITTSTITVGTCRWIAQLFDQGLDGMRFIAGVGPVALFGSTVVGLALLAITVFAA